MTGSGEVVKVVVVIRDPLRRIDRNKSRVGRTGTRTGSEEKRLKELVNVKLTLR